MPIKLTDDGTTVWAPCSECKTYPNGVLAEVCDACWGTFCQHGIKIVSVTPETQGMGLAREGRTVSPWPCPECSQQEFEAELAQEEADHNESQHLNW